MNRQPLSPFMLRIRSNSCSRILSRVLTMNSFPSKKNRDKYSNIFSGSMAASRQYLLRKRELFYEAAGKLSLQPFSLMKYRETDLVILCFFPSKFLPPILMSKIFGKAIPCVRFQRTMNLLDPFLILYLPARCVSQAYSFLIHQLSPSLIQGSS